MTTQNENQVTQVTSSQRERGQTRRVFTFKAAELIWLLVGILEATIAIRIGLKLIGANPDAPIVAMIYGFTQLFLLPFTGMIASPSAGNLVLEISSVFAMLIYALLAWALERTIWLIFYRPRGPVVDVTETKTNEHHAIR